MVPSIRAHTLLKQISAQASETATEDQATDHTAQNKIQRTQFELNVTEDPPTGDQLRTILEYVGSGGGRAGQIVEGATDEADALKKLKEDPSRFKPPVVRLTRNLTHTHRGNITDSVIRLWTGTMAGLVSRSIIDHVQDMADNEVVFGFRESEILRMISQLPKETDSV